MVLSHSKNIFFKKAYIILSLSLSFTSFFRGDFDHSSINPFLPDQQYIAQPPLLLPTISAPRTLQKELAAQRKRGTKLWPETAFALYGLHLSILIYSQRKTCHRRSQKLYKKPYAKNCPKEKEPLPKNNNSHKTPTTHPSPRSKKTSPPTADHRNSTSHHHHYPRPSKSTPAASSLLPRLHSTIPNKTHAIRSNPLPKLQPPPS